MADHEEEPQMTGLLEQPKTEPMRRMGTATAPSRTHRVLSDEGVPALLVEHVTKRFLIGRKRKSVTAVNDI